TKEPYTGAIYAAEKFSTCSQVVENAKQISITFPPPTISTNCGTVIRDGKLEALVVVSLDGVLPHQVTTEWDRFYRVSCDVSMEKMSQEGSVVVTTIYDAGEANTKVLDVGTPPPITATLSFLDAEDKPLGKASIGDQIQLVVTSEQAGPHNMMITECTATRVGGEGETLPFTIIDNGCPRYPALVGPVEQDFDKNRLKSDMKAFRLDGSYDIQIQCTIMFCAGANGCPPSNCLDSGTNELFVSHGRRKRGEGETLPFTIIENGCPRYPALVGPVEQDFDKNRLKSDMKAFRLDGSYDIQIQCTIMFCAGANGCPPSNCLDSGTNELFVSHGRRKREISTAEDQTAETLSAIIRVLAKGEEEEAALFSNATKDAYDVQFAEVSMDTLCMSEVWFVSMVVTMSMVCLILSSLIIIWGCSSIRQDSKNLPM
uniref:ZP domain-containing protein n=1 Tax=Panagrolaimus sp. PS1159 TaxID=55785 RepID=A0AC35GWT9_9BILA